MFSGALSVKLTVMLFFRNFLEQNALNWKQGCDISFYQSRASKQVKSAGNQNLIPGQGKFLFVDTKGAFVQEFVSLTDFRVEQY